MSADRFDLDLTRPALSGVYFVGVDDLDRLARIAARDDLHVCRTDLAGCHDKDELLHRLAVSLQLPASFGHNWDALEECLADLEWLPAKGYVLCFTNPESILPDDEEEFATFLEVLSDAGEAWGSGQAGPEGKRPVPFHTLLTVSDREHSKFRRCGLPQITAAAARPSGRTRSSR